MTIKPIPVKQINATWFMMLKGPKRHPEHYTDVHLCVYIHAADIHYITRGYLGSDYMWFTSPDDKKIDGEILAWASLDDNPHILALIAGRDWKLWR